MAKMLFAAKPKITGKVVSNKTPFLATGFLSAQISRKVQPNINALAIPKAKLNAVLGV